MDDLISRQAAIDAFGLAADIQHMGEKTIRQILTDIPSAQPEIIRCRDCKHRDPEDKKCDCGHDIVWNLPRQDDWFCADAKRRTDEQTKN